MCVCLNLCGSVANTSVCSKCPKEQARGAANSSYDSKLLYVQDFAIPKQRKSVSSFHTHKVCFPYLDVSHFSIGHAIKFLVDTFGLKIRTVRSSAY